jgi:hypothetical protein
MRLNVIRYGVLFLLEKKMTNLETVMKDLESEWIRLTEEVRAVYGQKHPEKYRVNIKLTNDSCVYVYLFLKHSKSGRLILHMDHSRWRSIPNAHPYYQSVICNIVTRYDLIRFQ